MKFITMLVMVSLLGASSAFSASSEILAEAILIRSIGAKNIRILSGDIQIYARMKALVSLLSKEHANDFNGWVPLGTNSKGQEIFVKGTEPSRSLGQNGAEQYEILHAGTVDFRIGTKVTDQKFRSQNLEKVYSKLEFKKLVEESMNGVNVPGTLVVGERPNKIFDLKDGTKLIVKEFTLNPVQMDLSIMENILALLTK